MRDDLGQLQLTRIIVHEIPLRLASGKGESLRFSEAESVVSDEVRNYFREKIIKSLANNSYDVVFDPDTESAIPSLALNLLKKTTRNFVKHSCSVGERLHACQTGVNKASLLVVAQATVARKRSLAILKLEKEAGLRLRDIERNGKRTYTLQHLSDLMLGEHTKVFKAGLFCQKGATVDSIVGLVSDNQRGYTPSTEVADFFLERFLGCRLLEAAEVSTKRFFEAAQSFINDEVTDPKLKAQYQIALMAEMASEAASVSPRLFANANLRPGDRKAFLAALEADDCPLGKFDKDAKLIAAHLHRIQLEFAGGVLVLGTPAAFEKQVEMKELEDGRTRLQIVDVVKKFRGRK